MLTKYDFKYSSPIFFNQLLCKTMKKTQNNLPKMGFSFFELEIWCVNQDCLKQQIKLVDSLDLYLHGKL